MILHVVLVDHCFFELTLSARHFHFSSVYAVGLFLAISLRLPAKARTRPRASFVPLPPYPAFGHLLPHGGEGSSQTPAEFPVAGHPLCEYFRMTILTSAIACANIFA